NRRFERVAGRPAQRGTHGPRARFSRRRSGCGLGDRSVPGCYADYGLPLVRAAVEGLFTSERLDAIVYPTSPRRPALLAAPPDTTPASPTASATNIANLTGFPDLIVPAGFTGDNLPVGISFFCLDFTEEQLLYLV